ncbi:MAG: hypothetical protein Ct9H300mP1_10850 [Planctomycetaceae bacterium]|nr:MAG: hypothetical protein Ct9H300mP1_10850 [Planctomycetaceae bacterium]
MSLNPKQVTARPQRDSRPEPWFFHWCCPWPSWPFLTSPPPGSSTSSNAIATKGVEIIETHPATAAVDRVAATPSSHKTSTSPLRRPIAPRRSRPLNFPPSRRPRPRPPTRLWPPRPQSLRRLFPPPPVFQSAASPPPAPPPPCGRPIPSTRTPVARYAMRPTPGVPSPSTPVRPIAPPVIYQRETVVKHVP